MSSPSPIAWSSTCIQTVSVVFSKLPNFGGYYNLAVLLPGVILEVLLVVKKPSISTKVLVGSWGLVVVKSSVGFQLVFVNIQLIGLFRGLEFLLPGGGYFVTRKPVLG